MKIKKHILPFQNKYLTGVTLAVLFLLSTLAAGAREARDTIIPSSITARPTWNGAVDSAWFIADVTSTQTRKVSGATIIQRAIKYTDSTQMLAAYLAAINSHTAQLASHLSSINLNTAAVALINVQLPKKVDSVKVNGSTLYYYANGGIAYPAGTVTTSGGTASTVPWTGVTGTPTTIAGYGITDAYTKSQIATVGTTGDYNSLINKPNLSPYSINNIQTEYKPFTGSQTFALANAPTKVILVHLSQTGAPMNNPAITQYSVSGANVTITQPTLQSGDTLEFVYDISTFVNTLPTGAYSFTGTTSQVTLGNGTYTSLAGIGGLAASNVTGQYQNGFKAWGSLITDSMKVGASYSPLAGTVTAGNTVTQAFQKLDGNIAANTSSIASNTSGIATNTSNIGTLSSLTTTAKSSLVAAINEVNAKPSGGGSGAVDSFYLSNRDFAGAGTVSNPYTIVKSYSISSATDSTAASSLAVFNGLLTKVDSIRNVSGALAFLKNGTWNSFGTVPIANSQLTNDVGFVTGMQYLQNGTLINSTPRSKLNLIPGSNVASIVVVDNPGQSRVDVTINASLGGSGSGVTTDNVPHNYVTGYNTDGTLEADSVTIGAAYTAGTSYGAVTTSDNVLTALQKLDGNWSSSLGTGSIKSAKAMGVSVIAQTDGVDISAAQTAQGMSAQVMIFSSIYLDKPATITGVWISPTTTGSFTGNLENSISLYSYSGGVLTRVATTANDPTIFQKTGSVIVQIPFASTYSAAAGQYFVGALMNSTGTVTTQPFLSAMAGKTYASTWLGKNYFQITGMTASPSTVTLASQTGLSTIGTKTWFALY